MARFKPKKADLNQEPKLIKVDEDTLRVAQELIEQVHSHLEDAKIEFLFRTDTKWSKAGEVQATKGVMLFLSSYNFVITINRVLWNAMTVKAKYAFMDQLLCYCKVKISEGGNKTWFKAKPDFEGFFGNYERFGEWTQTLQQLARIQNQLKLFDNGGALELAREATEMRELEEYYQIIDNRYGNPEAFPRMQQVVNQ